MQNLPDMTNENKFDKILMQALTEGKGFEGYLDVVFGYLGRGTDFYMQEDTARRIVNEKLESHIQRFRQNTKLHEEIARKNRKLTEKIKRERERDLQEKLKSVGGSAALAEVSSNPAKT